jgi:phosphopantothenoylcysteine decarboxylase/phosphopantothenate--cysteine ligase
VVDTRPAAPASRSTPVRVIANRSSGKQGYAVAARRRRGADVVLVSTVDLPPRRRARRRGRDRGRAAGRRRGRAGADVDRDGRRRRRLPAQGAPPGKLKKHDGVPEIVLEPTPDILAGSAPPSGRARCSSASPPRPPTSSPTPSQAAAKRLDLIVANDVSAPGVGFGHDTNAVTLLRPDADPSPSACATSGRSPGRPRRRRRLRTVPISTTHHAEN